MTPTNDHKSSDLYTVLAGMGVVCLVGIMLVANLYRLANELGPQLGELITFDPTRPASSDTHAGITALRLGDASAVPCVLDVRVMLASGGSLLIDATPFDPTRPVRAHWIGARTSDGATDCGTAADLLLSRSDIGALTFAANGAGFTAK